MESPLPNSIQAEQDVLSAMMLEPEYCAVGVEMCTPADFYRPAHSLIFEAIRDLFLSNRAVDIHLLGEELTRRGHIDECGGVEYLMAALSQLPSGSRIADYARVVISHRRRRDLLTYSAQLAQQAREGEDVEDVVSSAISRILKISDRAGEKGLVTVMDVCQDVMEELNQRQSGELPLPWFKLGIPGVDRYTRGVDNRVIVITGSGTSQGKTSLAMQAVEANDGPSDYFSMEMSAKSLVKRWVASCTGINTSRLNTGDVGAEDMESVVGALARISSHNLRFYDRPTDVARLSAMVHRSRMLNKVELVFVDYVGLLKSIPGSRADRREREVAENIQALQDLAGSLGLQVVIVSQISRKNQERKDKRATLSDLKESGEIENAADLVIAIHNPPQEGREEDPRAAEIAIIKQRNGPLGRAEVMWHPQRMRFYSREHDENEPPYWAR